MGKELFIILAIAFISLIFLFTNKSKIIQLNPGEFENLMEDNEVFILQAHVPYDGEIEGTNLIMTEWQSPESYTYKLPDNKDKKIAVYCRSGRMSQITAEKLIDMGYSNIYNLEGGMNSWKESGKELIYTK